MESFNRGEHVVGAFLDVEKAFDNVWHNGLRHKIFRLDTLALRFSSWPCNSSQRKWFLVHPNKPQSRVSTGFRPESITFSDLRQRPPNTAPQTKLTIPIRWWYCTMGFQLKCQFCSKTIATGPSKLGNVVCQMENQTESRKTKVIIFSRSKLARKTEPNLKLYGETLKVCPQVKFLGITFDSQLTFQKHFEGTTRYHRLKLLANETWGSINNASDLFLSTALFDNYHLWQYHQQTSTAPK